MRHRFATVLTLGTIGLGAWAWRKPRLRRQLRKAGMETADMIKEEMRRDASGATEAVKEYATGNVVTRGLRRTKRMVGRRFTSVKKRAVAEIEDTKRAARAATRRVQEESSIG